MSIEEPKELRDVSIELKNESREERNKLNVFGLPRIDSEILRQSKMYIELSQQLKEKAHEVRPPKAKRYENEYEDVETEPVEDKRYLSFREILLGGLTQEQQYEFEIFQKSERLSLSDIDAPIKSIIERLNELPLATYSSCSGHLQPGSKIYAFFSHGPYIDADVTPVPEKYAESAQKFLERFMRDLHELSDKLNIQYGKSEEKKSIKIFASHHWIEFFRKDQMHLMLEAEWASFQNAEEILRTFWQEIWNLLEQYDGGPFPSLDLELRSEDFQKTKHR